MIYILIITLLLIYSLCVTAKNASLDEELEMKKHNYNLCVKELSKYDEMLARYFASK